MKYLDLSGLGYFWTKIKAYVLSLVSGKADDSDVVHKTGGEDVSGLKTFAGDFHGEMSGLAVKSNDIDRGSAPASDKFCSLNFVDKDFDVSSPDTSMDASRLAGIDYAARQTGRVDFQFIVLRPNTSTNEDIRFRIGFDANGIPYFIGPSTKDNPGNGEIITYDWLPKDTRLVHTTGVETISGTKTFTSDIYADWSYYTFFDIAKGALPSATKYRGIYFLDSSKDINSIYRFANVEARIETNGNSLIYFTAYKNVAGDNANTTRLVVGWDGNIAYATAPATSDSRTNGTDIVTRNWLASDSRLVHTSGNELIAGVKTFTSEVKSDSFYFSYFNVLKGASVSTVTNRGLIISDSNRYVSSQYRLGQFLCQLNTDGTSLAYMSSYKNEANSNTAAHIIVGWDSNGSYATAPSTRSNRTEGTDIVTRDWIPNDTRIVHTSGNETITGAKTFGGSAGSILSISPYDYVMYKQRINFTKGAANPETAKFGTYVVFESGQNNDYYDNRIGAFEVVANISGNITASMIAYKNLAANHTSTSITLTFPKDAATTSCYASCPTIYPHADNTYFLGGSNVRWKIVYAATGTINTSDERIKHEINKVSDTVLDVWQDIEWKQFKMLDAVQEKGINSARIHIGTIAQHIDAVFKAHGLDASRYGLFCYDEWEEEKEVRNQIGDIVTNYRPAGNRYSLRYEEALCMEAAYMRRENARLKKRVADLEERLAALELKMS